LKTECEILANSYKNILFPDGDNHSQVSQSYMKDLDIMGEPLSFCGYKKDLMQSEDLLTSYPSTVADSRFVIDLDDEKFEEYINELNASM